MPELDDLIEALRADTARARWTDATALRTGADRRRRRRRVVTVAAVVVVVLALAGLGGLIERAGRAAPSAPPAASPTASADVAPGALLTPADLGSGYVTTNRFNAPYAPNPFVNCGRDGYPYDSDVVSARGTGMAKPGAYSGVGESVLAFRPGTAHLAMAGIGELLTGPCRGHFTLVGRDLAGDESMLIRDEDAQPGNAGARRIAYHAIIRSGDHIAWVTVVDYASRADLAAYARSVGIRAAQRMCTHLTC